MFGRQIEGRQWLMITKAKVAEAAKPKLTAAAGLFATVSAASCD